MNQRWESAPGCRNAMELKIEFVGGFERGDVGAIDWKFCSGLKCSEVKGFLGEFRRCCVFLCISKMAGYLIFEMSNLQLSSSQQAQPKATTVHEQLSNIRDSIASAKASKAVAAAPSAQNSRFQHQQNPMRNFIEEYVSLDMCVRGCEIWQHNLYFSAAKDCKARVTAAQVFHSLSFRERTQYL